ncbi:MAG: lytic transglycosylase domain-containing protein [Capsulimonadaceae bacterium]|nr:lytic transglycosylase domain-containing protein [Capsulimonadaceae bacterium]
MTRIQQIQAHIEQLDGEEPSAPPAAPPQSFDAALQSAGVRMPRNLPSLAAIQPLSPSALTMRALPGGNTNDYAALIQASANKYGVDPNLVSAVVQAESDGNPAAVSRAGAKGLMQLMPANETEYGVTNPFDPEQNIDAGTHQLSNLLSQFGGDIDLALAAYNAGPNAVRRAGGIPPYPETQEYVRKVRGLMADK